MVRTQRVNVLRYSLVVLQVTGSLLGLVTGDGTDDGVLLSGNSVTSTFADH
jgi:hypothetical protein